MAVTVIVKSGDATGTGEQQDSSSVPTTNKSQPNQKGSNSLAKGAINTALIQASRQVISQGINTYTEISGDTATSRQISGIASAGADIVMIAKGGIIGIGAVVAKHAYTALTSEIKTRKANLETEKRNALLGEISMKGSRY